MYLRPAWVPRKTGTLAAIHYKTLGGWFPEKQPGTIRTVGYTVFLLGAKMLNYKGLYAKFPAKF
jgi:hypothetical protein